MTKAIPDQLKKEGIKRVRSNADDCQVSLKPHWLQRWFDKDLEQFNAAKAKKGRSS